MTITLTPPQGWQCPACGGVYAPWMATCTECKPRPTGLRDRLDAARPPVPSIAGPLPLIESAPTTTTQPVALTLNDARSTWCSGAVSPPTSTFTFPPATPQDREHGDDDGTAGVPARI